jgi:hypothetical protein
MADKEKIKSSVMKKLLSDTTIGGGIGIEDTEWYTKPRADLNLTKGKTTVGASLAKGFSKIDKRNINSEIGINLIRESDKGHVGVEAQKVGKNKYVGFNFSKKFNQGGKVQQAYLGKFISGGPGGSNATYRKYYKGMLK